MSLKRGLKLKTCSWESVNWTKQGFEQSLWSVLHGYSLFCLMEAIISMLVSVSDENVFIGRDLSPQGVGQMLGQR